MSSESDDAADGPGLLRQIVNKFADLFRFGNRTSGPQATGGILQAPAKPLEFTTLYNGPVRTFAYKNGIVPGPSFYTINNSVYTVTGKIGEGTYANTWSVQDGNGNQYALRIEVGCSEEQLRRIIVQFELDARISYDFGNKWKIGPWIYGAGIITSTSIGRPVLLMLMELGAPVTKICTTPGFSSLECFAAIMPQVEKLLWKMVKHNTYCVDIKPDNSIMSLATGRVLLIDFGGGFCMTEWRRTSMVNSKKLTPLDKESYVALMILQYAHVLSNELGLSSTPVTMQIGNAQNIAIRDFERVETSQHRLFESLKRSFSNYAETTNFFDALFKVCKRCRSILGRM